jgi:hypothetical protein
LAGESRVRDVLASARGDRLTAASSIACCLVPLRIAPGETAELRLRPAGAAGGKQTRAADPLGSGFDRVVKQRRAEADEFYAELTPEGAKPDEAMVMRQAFAGMLWSKQPYNDDVARWLDG